MSEASSKKRKHTSATRFDTLSFPDNSSVFINSSEIVGYEMTQISVSFK